MIVFRKETEKLFALQAHSGRDEVVWNAAKSFSCTFPRDNKYQLIEVLTVVFYIKLTFIKTLYGNPAEFIHLIPTLQKLSQEDQMFKTRLDCIACLRLARLPSEFEVNLYYMILCLNKQMKEKNTNNTNQTIYQVWWCLLVRHWKLKQKYQSSKPALA